SRWRTPYASRSCSTPSCMKRRSCSLAEELMRAMGFEGVGGPLRLPQRGVPWLGWTCGACEYCRSERENLCPRARFTGRDIDGGMAQYALADERYCFAIPD